MQPIPRDTPVEGRIHANEVNLLESWRYVATQCGGAVYDDPDLFVFATGIPLPFFNGACRATVAEDAVAERIAFATAWLRRHGVPGEWVICPSTRPPDLESRLVGRGFIDAGHMTAMDLDLLTLAGDESLPAGVTIERVRTRDDMWLWAEASLMAFGAPADVARPGVEILARLSPDDEHTIRFYLARESGESVGTSLLFCGGGVAGLYSVATFGHARKRGIGRALTLAPLRDARAMGYGVAVLQASAMGYPVYRRIGFEERAVFRSVRWPDV